MKSNRWKSYRKLCISDLIASLATFLEYSVSQTQFSETTNDMCVLAMNFIDVIRPQLRPQDQIQLVKLVQSMLKARNVPILQSVHDWLVKKVRSPNHVKTNRYREDLLFVVSCLCSLGKLLLI